MYPDIGMDEEEENAGAAIVEEILPYLQAITDESLSEVLTDMLQKYQAAC